MVVYNKVRTISIHALRVEGDSSNFSSRLVCKDFYPRPPGGGRRVPFFALCSICRFLSTPSGWRATAAEDVDSAYDGFLSTPSGWRATKQRRRCRRLRGFLSTPSGWRATVQNTTPPRRSRTFLSTPSGWRATAAGTGAAAGACDFYPRPPGGGRPAYAYHLLNPPYFYPRPPGGGRRKLRKTVYQHDVFLSTPSGWRATPRSKFAMS